MISHAFVRPLSSLPRLLWSLATELFATFVVFLLVLQCVLTQFLLEYCCYLLLEVISYLLDLVGVLYFLGRQLLGLGGLNLSLVFVLLVMTLVVGV